MQQPEQSQVVVGGKPGVYPNDPSVPDIYAEGAGIQVGLTGVSIIFNRITHDPPELVPVGVVRMSLEQAFALTQTLRKSLQAYQQQIGPIAVPDILLRQLGIDREL